MKGWLAAALAALTLALASPSWATTAVLTRPGFDTLSGCPSQALTPCWKPWDATNPLPVSGTFSASLAGFTPTPSYSQLSASDTANHSVAAPTGVDDVISNLDTNVAYCNFGAASTTSTFPIPAGVAYGFHNGGAFSTFQCQSPTSSLKITVSGGAGLFTGGGGGGSGGSSGGGGPLGVQAISNSQAVNPATNSIWSQTGAPNITTVSSTPITVPDTNQICTSTGWGNQTACTGTPTTGSAYQVAVTSAGYIWVQVQTTSGTPTVNFAIRISNDGGTTWFNRGIFALTNVSPFQINNISNLNFAGWLTGGVTNVEVIATTYTGTGSTTVTITQGQATPFVTSSATSSSLNGTGATAATNVQGNGTSALPVNTDLQQQANVALAAPTAIGTPTTGNVPAIQGAGTGAVVVAVDTASSGNLINAVEAPVPNPNTASAWGILAQGSSTASELGQLMMGAVTTGAPSYSTTQTSPLSLDTAGNLRVNVVTGGSSGGTSSSFGSAFPATGTALGLTNGTNMVAWSATTNYGTAPAAIAVPAVNAFVTNLNGGAAVPGSSSSVVGATMSHASTTALGTSLVAKASAGNLGAYNCTAITGGAAGFCIIYNGTAAPSTGALTGANVIDFCFFDTSAKGCSLTRLPNSIALSTGIVVLITSAASPYTYTTGTDTGAIEADYF